MLIVPTRILIFEYLYIYIYIIHTIYSEYNLNNSITNFQKCHLDGTLNNLYNNYILIYNIIIIIVIGRFNYTN